VVNFTPRPLYFRGKASDILWKGGWFGPRSDMEVVEKRKSLVLKGIRNLTYNYLKFFYSVLKIELRVGAFSLDSQLLIV
jgi:hypothetical protein